MTGIVLVTMLSATLADADMPTPAALEAAVIESRTKIRSGTFDFTIHTDETLFARVHAAFDEKGRKRFDFAQYMARPAGTGDIVEYDTRKFLVDDVASIWRLTVHPEQVHASGEIRRQTDEEREVFLDPRMLGRDPGPFESAFHTKIDTLIGIITRKSTSVSSDTVDGVRVWRLDLVLDNNVKVRFYVDPAQGSSIIKSELLPPIGTATTTRIDLKEFKPKLWFPTQIEYTTARKSGDSVTETIKFERVQLNVAEETEFSLEGLGMPVGTEVSDHTQGDKVKIRIWDGNNWDPRGDGRSFRNFCYHPLRSITGSDCSSHFECRD